MFMPDWKRYIQERLSPLGLKPERELEIVEELAEHLENAYQDALTQGASREEAIERAGALIPDWRFLECEVSRVVRPSVDQRIDQTLENQILKRKGRIAMGVLFDLKYGLRMLFKHKAFTAAAVLSLALGIGANTAIFSLINTVMLKSLPVQNPDDLVLLSILHPSRGTTAESFSYPLYEQFRDRTQSLTGVIASGGGGRQRMILNEPGAADQIESVQAEIVSGNYFTTLGVQAIRGRALTPEDDRAGNPQPVVVISYGFWERRFGLDPSIVGKSIRLNDVPFTIIGVAPPGFNGFEVGRRPDVWEPLQMIPQLSPGRTIMQERGSWWLRLMGRLRPGATPGQAQAELDVVFQQMLAEMAESRAARLGSNWKPAERRAFLERKIELQPGRTGWTELRKQFKQSLLILMTIVGLVLAVACANVANLLLARSATRRKEIAMRLALGAGRWRLIRQLLTESLLLAVISGALGLFFARWGAQLLLSYVGMALNLDLDLSVLGFTTAVSVLTGVLFGLAPALRATRLDLVSMMKDQTNFSDGSGSRLTLSKALVVTQVALSLTLLVGAGLFVRSLQKLRGVDMGIERENVILFSLDLGSGYDPERRAALFRQLLDRLDALPGAQSVSLSNFGLLSDNNWSDGVTFAGGETNSNDKAECFGQVVGPKYFETMGIQILQGRGIGPEDTKAAGDKAGPAPPRVAVINQTMARHFFPNESPIGKRFSIIPQKDQIEVVGVVKDAKYKTLGEETRRTFYAPYFQMLVSSDTTFEIRTLNPLAGMTDSIRRTVRELDPKVQVLNLRTMNDVVDATLTRERLVAQLAGFFSLFALLLSAIGLYGVMSFTVTRRTKEIGVRMALGAQEGDVLRMMLRETLWLVGVGAVVGLAGAFAATRLIKNLLFGLTPNDPATILGATLLLMLVAALAGYFPARKAARVDPMVALRVE
jgi:predicted permease